MFVYVLECGDYADRYVAGVYRSVEDAIAGYQAIYDAPTADWAGNDAGEYLYTTPGVPSGHIERFLIGKTL